MDGERCRTTAFTRAGLRREKSKEIESEGSGSPGQAGERSGRDRRAGRDRRDSPSHAVSLSHAASPSHYRDRTGENLRVGGLSERAKERERERERERDKRERREKRERERDRSVAGAPSLSLFSPSRM